MPAARAPAALAGLLLAGAACQVTLKDPAGGACDSTHVCLDGQVCRGGVCSPAPDDSGCAPTDAGAALLWSQCRDGFGPLAPGDGTLSADGGNALSARVLGATVTGPAASAAVDEVPLDAFRLRGTVVVNAAPPLQTTSALIDVRAGPRPLVEVFIDAERRLEVQAQPGLLGSSETATPTSSPVATAGASHALDLRWKRGSYCRLFIDRALAEELTAAGTSTLDERADALVLGILSLSAGPSTGYAVELRDFELLSDPGPATGF